MTGTRVRVLACHVQWGEGLYSEVRHLPFCWQQAAKGNSYFPWCPWPSVGQSGGWFVHIKPDQLPNNYLGDQPSRKHYSQSHIQKDEVCPTWYSWCLCFRQWPTVHSSWVQEVQQAMEIWASHNFTEVPQKQWKSRKCCLSSQTTDEKSEELFQCLPCSPQLPQYANTSLSCQSSPTTDDLPTTKILLVPEVTMGQHQKILANKQHKISDLLFTFQSGLHYMLCNMNHSQAVILSGTNWIREKFKGFCL